MPDAYTVSTTPEYSELLTKLVSRDLLSLLRGGLTYGPPGALKTMVYQTGHEDAFVYGQVPDLAATVPPPMDELIPPSVELIESVVDEFATTEYARSIGFSSKLLRQQPFGPAQVISERVSRAAAELVNLILKAEWEAAHSGELTIGDGTADAATDMLINAKAILQQNNVPPIDGAGNYACLCSPFLVADLMKEQGERAWTASQQQNPANLEAGELARWQGIIFYGDSTSTPATGTEETAIVTGAEAMAVADLGSLATYLVLPTASIADPVAQRGIASYRIRLGAQAIARFLRQGDTTPVFNFVKLNVKLNKPTVVVTP